MRVVPIFFLAVLLCWGCAPDEGGFRPKKRVAAVYEERLTLDDGDTLYVQPRLLSERWNWDGKKLLSIDYYNGNALEVSEVYAYDEDRRICAASLSGSFTEVYHYGGDKLDSISVYASDGRWVESVALAHSRIRVKKVTWNRNGSSSSCKLTWKDENIEKIIPEDTSEHESSLGYDNMTNPFEGLVSWWRLRRDNGLAETFSSNNLLQISSPESDSYSYSYLDGYPISRTHVKEYDYIIYVWDPALQRNREQTVHRYEKTITWVEYL